MSASQSHTQTQADRATRIRQVVMAVIARRLAGEDVPDDAVLATNAELMPELAEGLRDLWQVEQARRQAEGVLSTLTRDHRRPPAPRRAGPAADAIPGYELHRELHRGGQGVVYLATQLTTQRQVAVKVLREGHFAGAHDKARFEQEVHVLAQLHHPNIITIHDSGEAGGLFYYVMDYIVGVPLDVYVDQHMRDDAVKTSKARSERASALRRPSSAPPPRPASIDDEIGPTIASTPRSVSRWRMSGRLSERSSLVRRQRARVGELLTLFAKVCEAVNAAHLRGVIHRDLKPGNILVDEDGEPHILDFGLAKLSGETDAPTGPAMTQTGQFLGSLPWAAPEQAEGAPGKIDLRTDVYALGVILYQLLTGRFPYAVIGNIRDVLDNIMQTEPAKPSTIHRRINDEVETIVLKCLSKERERRYQSAGELARDVRRYLTGEAIEAKRDSNWYVLRKFAARHSIAATLVVCIPAILLSAAIFSLIMWHDAAEALRLKSASDAVANQQSRQLESVDDSLKPAIRRMGLGWFLLEYHADRRDRAAEIQRQLPADAPERAAMAYLLDDNMSEEQLLAKLTPESHGLAHFAIGERHFRHGQRQAAIAAFETAAATAPDGWLRASAAARLEQFRLAETSHTKAGNVMKPGATP